MNCIFWLATYLILRHTHLTDLNQNVAGASSVVKANGPIPATFMFIFVFSTWHKSIQIDKSEYMGLHLSTELRRQFNFTLPYFEGKTRRETLPLCTMLLWINNSVKNLFNNYLQCLIAKLVKCRSILTSFSLIFVLLTFQYQLQFQQYKLKKA